MPMNRANDSLVERFIGALTMALGAGSIIPRPGLGLYALLESSGERAMWSVLMLNFGCLLIAMSYMQNPLLRAFLLFAASSLWAGLVWKFVTAQLWGAALQGLVVISFSCIALYRRGADHRQGKTLCRQGKHEQ